ncbi:SRPBCC family protein [Methylomonas sp. LL1]|uniref:SRPBCC family protein n=1 Tax=Methylomonas sp. LL1 TaxID=2785785 RepID=UPI0018C42C67|nr:SRPBCC family protein [Methylomonas sp. LL1]QPK64910.1 SRPBCC family protein [Methylomonas sp. LL1]
MLDLILVLILIAVVVFVIVVARQPADFQVTRFATLSAPASVVFAQVNDLHKWDAWSPWAKLDPAAKSVFEGAEAGVGAIMRWSGNHKVGEGSMTIIESRPDELIRFKLEFLKPFKASNTAEFTFKPEGNQTVVTWSMSGSNNFIGKAMGLIMNCDKMVGTQFEQGLSAIKAIVEAGG